MERSEPSVVIKEHEGKQIEWTYLGCKSCGETYDVMYRDDSIRTLEEEYRKLNKRTFNPHLNSRKIKKEMKILEDKIKIKVEKLRVAHW